MQVSEVDKAFGTTFVDIEGLKLIGSLAYRKGGYLYFYLTEDISGKDYIKKEVEKEIGEVLNALLRLSSDDIKLKDHHSKEYKFIVLNEKNVKKAFNRISRAFKRRSEK